MANAVDRYRCWWKKLCLGSMTKWKRLSSGSVLLNHRKGITLPSVEGKTANASITCAKRQVSNSMPITA